MSFILAHATYGGAARQMTRWGSNVVRSRSTVTTGKNVMSSLSCTKQRSCQNHSKLVTILSASRGSNGGKVHGMSTNYYGTRCRNMTTSSSKPKGGEGIKATSKNGAAAESSSSSGSSMSFLQRWMAPKEIPPRWTPKWYGEMALLCTVFAITGTSTMVLVRPAVSDILGLKGSFKEGPWSFRICSLVIMTPIYATLLVMVGTVFGRHAYFRHFSVKMFSRFGIPPELMDKTFHETKKTFRKY
mmetsp:Transcript_23046/g.41590  ORF Transcript_23046/g.41590 Transcript_23046/m.41590 type:complete len:243 (-) Transcript_23046:215-943(-)|eukprot:CAMPEP_0198295740 /NCGR_PEP_ID=MMETSP1449-20131203/29299_1 /TAXON_ID=420275 /ORGANISM="Attheya septentrionalis, Strain CCMP2084" /LENGTH=242 /DNA_ID=CAMNT_0043996137 /DNA_START=183 /DNA_END=911 /DNA_ORIENTATION=+